MSGIGKELSTFLQAILAGNTVFWSYQLLRILREIIKHHPFFVSAEDFFFWIGTGFFLFCRMYDTSDGSIRWYFVLGVVVGAILPLFLTVKWRKLRKKKLLHNEKKQGKMKISGGFSDRGGV